MAADGSISIFLCNPTLTHGVLPPLGRPSQTCPKVCLLRDSKSSQADSEESQPPLVTWLVLWPEAGTRASG